jgi:hypothetical protein
MAINFMQDDLVDLVDENTTNTLPELRSIIADPQLTDPSLDISNLRTTTPTRSELLANVPEFSGLKYDPTNRDYYKDLYALYGAGLPTLETDTAQIPGAVDTLVDVGGGGGMDQATGGSLLDTAQIPGAADTLVNVGGGADMGTVPATGQIGDGSITVENIAQNQTPYDVPMDIDDPGASIENIIAQQNLSTIQEPPTISPVTTSIDAQGNIYSMRAEDYGTYLGNKFDEVALTGQQEQQEGFIQNVLGRVGQTVEGALNELGKVPGAIADFTDEKIDIFGKKLDVGKTLALAAINRAVGAPISLVFDALGSLNLPGGPTLQTQKADSIGLLNPNATAGYQDKYGINTQSAFGDYDQYAIDKEQELQEKFNNGTLQQYDEDGNLTYQGQKHADYKEYNTISGVGGDITPDATPTDIATGNITGDGSVAEQVAQKEKQEAFADIQNQIGQSLHGGGGSKPAPAPAAPTNVGNPFGYGGGGGQDSGGGGGGGGSGSSSGGGGESGYGGFCFDPNTPIQMADGSTKKIKNIQLGDDTKGGEVTGVFQFKATDEIHDYKGVTVAGSHYVKEDGKFIMVQDSPISVKIDKIPVVYSLDTTGRRIFIKDIEFADYNGDGIAKGFLANAGVDTKGFDKEVLRQVENRLI